MPQYKISLWGYGGESSYIKFTRDCYTHWQNQKKYDGIRDSLLDYITEQHQTAPPIAAFLKGEKGKKQDWIDAKDRMTDDKIKTALFGEGQGYGEKEDLEDMVEQKGGENFRYTRKKRLYKRRKTRKK